METTLKTPASFRFQTGLLNRLKALAKENHRSLNNYVESLLLDIVYNEPNEETVEAIREAKENKNMKEVDMTNLDTFIKSLTE